jgi:outer membrane protein assembly factor BamE (lipoprotein component of BamABCDE complex)
MRKVAISLVIVGLLSGCVSVGRQIDQTSASKIEKGKTTKEQVVMLIGSPDQIMSRGNGEEIYYYKYTRATAKPATFIPIFGPLVGGANVQHQMFMVTFDSNGVVKDYFNSRGATETSHGLTTGSKPEIPEVEQGKRPK